MDASQFDPATFLDDTMSAPLEKRPPLPVGRGPIAGDYLGVIGEPRTRAWTSKKDPTKSGLSLDVPLNIEVPPNLQEEFQLKPIVQVTHGIFLDITPTGSIDMAPGSNRGLRMYREACDMNKPGDTFSIRGMAGKPVRIKISHDVYEGQPVERVAAVARV
jgi:hypothetical protein